MKNIRFNFKCSLTTFKKKKKSFFIKNKINTSSQKFNVQIANNLNLLFTGISKKKSFDRWVSLFIPAQEANLLPPVGPFLGQHGFNTQNFCNSFNSLTLNYPKGLPIKTNIQLFSDKSILFWLQTPPSSFLIYSCLNSNKIISCKDIFKIMIIKKLDSPSISYYSLISSIIGTVKSMSVTIDYNL